MGEELLKNPLDILNETEVFDVGLPVGEVLKRAGIKDGSQKKDKDNFYRRLFGMYNDGLISLFSTHEKADMDKYSQNEAQFSNVDSVRIRISAKGFDLLNQIRIKQALEKLDTSINNFNGASQASFLNLKDTVATLNITLNDFSVASKSANTILHKYTLIIAVLTLLLAANSILTVLFQKPACSYLTLSSGCLTIYTLSAELIVLGLCYAWLFLSDHFARLLSKLKS